jgi:KUP system potassium uptake protein
MLKMAENGRHIDISKLSLAGVIVTLGIVFGDLGTSPLYVMKAIAGGREITELLIYGSMSCIFWTLTLQTTVKYVLITLKINNNGEGGIYALFAMLRKKPQWAALLTMIGASALLADGVITPAITVTSSVEGLKLFNPGIPVVTIVLIIFAALFFMQRFGTNLVGGSFGPVMVVWFLMLAVTGFTHIIENTSIMRALSPVYAVKFLSRYPGGFILLGAVFLATTGAEALYSDLGHCGLKNIRISWFFVKSALVINYLGQCAWIMNRQALPEGTNPFYGIMPDWFLVPGILISTAAAIIASQALITGSYTLISEAISLNFWPKQRINNPTSLKGQVYVPFVNWFLWLACSGVVIFFRESSNMEAAYGLSITLTMIMTTLLLSFYLYQKKINYGLIALLLTTYIMIEGSFLVANLHKFRYGGWFTLLLASVFFTIMYGWYFGRKLKNKYVTFVKLSRYTNVFRDLSKDVSVPKTATNLVYIIKANHTDQVESKVIYSIFQKQPKRADTYWFLHVDIKDEPYTFEYRVTHIIPGILIRVDFYLGFKVKPRINLYFREVLEDLQKSGEISLDSSFEILKKRSIPADFLFVLIDRVMIRDYDLTLNERITLMLHRISRILCISDVRALTLDPTSTIEEKVPITAKNFDTNRIKRAGALISKYGRADSLHVLLR